MTRAENERWPDVGLTIMGLAAIVALVIGGVGYFSPASGIRDTGGAMLVSFSSLALVVVAVLLSVLEPRWWSLAVFLVILSVLDFFGTSVAAYFLERNLMIVAMVVAAVGLVYHLTQPRIAVLTRRQKQQSTIGRTI